MNVIQADSIWIGRCGMPGCRAVHFHILVDGELRAQAAIGCEEVESIVTGLREAVLEALAADGVKH